MGRNGAGKTTLLKMIAGALAPGPRRRAHRREPQDGLLRPAVARAPRPRADDLGADRRRTSRSSRSACCATCSARSSSRATTSRRRSGRCRAARRRGSSWRGCCSIRRTSSCSTSRRTTWIWRPRKCWSTSLPQFDGTMIFVSHDRTFLRGLSNRVLELGGESGTRREAARLSRVLRRVRAANGPRGAGGARLTDSALCGPRLGMGRTFLSCRSGRHHRTDFRSPHHRALAVDLKPGLVAVPLRHQHSYLTRRNLALDQHRVRYHTRSDRSRDGF